MIYLDYNATAPLRPEVKSAMLEVMGAPLNPSSIHASGRSARKLVEDARRAVLHSVNAGALVFCGSGTEANNLAVMQASGPLAVSAIEHESVFKVKNARFIQVGSNGIVDLGHLEEILKSGDCRLVSIMLANNETGIIQPVAEAAEIAHKYGALIHCDAVQGFGKIDIDFKVLGVDLMTISCHKIGGPVGAAALIHRADLELKPLMFGGGQEKNKRPGTENVTAIHGFGILAKNVSRETNTLQQHLEDEIEKLRGQVIGKYEERLPNTSYIIMPGMDAATQLIHFDTNGICVSSGSACSSGKVEISRVLKAMNVKEAKNAIRISTGWATKEEEINKFIEEWRNLAKKAAGQAA